MAFLSPNIFKISIFGRKNWKLAIMFINWRKIFRKKLKNSRKNSKLKEKTHNSRKKPITQGKNSTFREQFLRLCPQVVLDKKAWLSTLPVWLVWWLRRRCCLAIRPSVWWWERRPLCRPGVRPELRPFVAPPWSGGRTSSPRQRGRDRSSHRSAQSRRAET